MKKLFTLLALLATMSTAMAFDSFDVILDDGDTQSTSGFFTVNPGGGYNSKYTGTYNGHSYSKGLKMNSKSSITFQTTAESTITIVQSLTSNSDKYPRLDNDNLSRRVDDSSNKVGVFTIENVTAGTHQIVQGTGETGLLYVIVEYTETAKEKLASPEITYDAETGEVTIGTVANAEEYYYTLDGQAPSLSAADTYLYEEPFIVADGTTVKAIAVDTDDVYANSDPTEKVVLLNLTSIDAPTINVLNGTFYAISNVPYAKVEYSLNGSSWNKMARAITLDEDGTVYARASRGGIISDVASADVTIIPKPEGTSIVILSIDSGTNGGNVWKNEDDFQLAITGNAEKTWTAGSKKVTLDSDEYTTFKVSNGAQNTLTLPEGVTVKRMTIYSYINATSGTRTCNWKEVNGDEYDVNFLPMGAYSDAEDPEPDVRVYGPFDTQSITFTNGGEQLMFVMVLDV